MTDAPDLRARLADAVHRTLADDSYWLPAAGQARVVDAVHAVVTAPGYCPHCGRGDCAPTADEYEQMRQRAEKAEVKLREYDRAINWHTDCLSCSRVLESSYKEAIRAEKAEAALALANKRWGYAIGLLHQVVATVPAGDLRDRVLAALDGEEPHP